MAEVTDRILFVVLVACVLGFLAPTLYNLASGFVRHLRWKRRWKRDSMSAYRRYLQELDRARSTPAPVRQHRRMYERRR